MRENCFKFSLSEPKIQNFFHLKFIQTVQILMAFLAKQKALSMMQRALLALRITISKIEISK